MPTARSWRKWLRLGEWWLRRVIRHFTEDRGDRNRRSFYVVQSRTGKQRRQPRLDGMLPKRLRAALKDSSVLAQKLRQLGDVGRFLVVAPIRARRPDQKKFSARARESDIKTNAIDSQAFAVEIGRTTRTPATAESPPEFFSFRWSCVARPTSG
jgi:hypothetical protein